MRIADFLLLRNRSVTVRWERNVTTMSSQIDIPKEEIARFCRRYRIHRFSLFGSVLRDDFGPDSDVDVLVEFESDAKVDYFDLYDMEQELSSLLGRKVDLSTVNSLSKYFREDVLREAEVQYVAA